MDLKEVFQCLDPNQMATYDEERISDQIDGGLISKRLSEEELTPKTLDPYEVAIARVKKEIKESTMPEKYRAGAEIAIAFIESYAAQDKYLQTGVMLDETFKKKQ